MEQLIILLLIGLGSLVSSYIQNKKKREAEEQELREMGLPPPQPTGSAPIPGWPKAAGDWQEELRRMLQGERPPLTPTAPQMPPTALPPVIRTKLIIPTAESEVSEGDLSLPSTLRQSAAAHARAAQLAHKVESRFEAVEVQTRAHRAMPVTLRARPTGADVVRRFTRNRNALREAFIASLIFAPPVGLRGRDESNPLN